MIFLIRKFLPDKETLIHLWSSRIFGWRQLLLRYAPSSHTAHTPTEKKLLLYHCIALIVIPNLPNGNDCQQRIS